MKELYNKLGEKPIAICRGILFLGDIELSKYIYDKFTTRALFDKQFDQAMVIVKMVYQKGGHRVA